MNICTRCGKQRIKSSTLSEKIGNSTIVRIMYVCPDPECQKIVEQELKTEFDRRVVLKEEKERNLRYQVLLRNKRKAQNAAKKSL